MGVLRDKLFLKSSVGLEYHCQALDTGYTRAHLLLEYTTK